MWHARMKTLNAQKTNCIEKTECPVKVERVESKFDFDRFESIVCTEASMRLNTILREAALKEGKTPVETKCEVETGKIVAKAKECTIDTQEMAELREPTGMRELTDKMPFTADPKVPNADHHILEAQNVHRALRIPMENFPEIPISKSNIKPSIVSNKSGLNWSKVEYDKITLKNWKEAFGLRKDDIAEINKKIAKVTSDPKKLIKPEAEDAKFSPNIGEDIDCIFGNRWKIIFKVGKSASLMAIGPKDYVDGTKVGRVLKFSEMEIIPKKVYDDIIIKNKAHKRGEGPALNPEEASILDRAHLKPITE